MALLSDHDDNQQPSTTDYESTSMGESTSDEGVGRVKKEGKSKKREKERRHQNRMQNEGKQTHAVAKRGRVVQQPAEEQDQVESEPAKNKLEREHEGDDEKELLVGANGQQAGGAQQGVGQGNVGQGQGNVGPQGAVGQGNVGPQGAVGQGNVGPQGAVGPGNVGPQGPGGQGPPDGYQSCAAKVARRHCKYTTSSIASVQGSFCICTYREVLLCHQLHCHYCSRCTNCWNTCTNDLLHG